MKKVVLLLPVLTAIAAAQVVVPDGTKLRLRLDQTLTSATADEGQTVELSVAEAVRVDGVTVVPEGARASGTVVVAQEKRRMGRAGKLDFSVDRVRGVHGEWLPVRYTLTKKAGDSKAVSTGVITAGVAVVFWPAAPFILLRHGKDTQINKGVTFDVFIDGNHTLNLPSGQLAQNSATPQPLRPVPPAPGIVTVVAPASNPTPSALASNAPLSTSTEHAALAIQSGEPGADIEINGSFVGNTPTSVKVAPGQYTVTVRKGTQVWQRSLHVNAGSAVTLNATFEPTASPVARRR